MEKMRGSCRYLRQYSSPFIQKRSNGGPPIRRRTVTQGRLGFHKKFFSLKRGKVWFGRNGEQGRNAEGGGDKNERSNSVERFRGVVGRRNGKGWKKGWGEGGPASVIPQKRVVLAICWGGRKKTRDRREKGMRRANSFREEYVFLLWGRRTAREGEGEGSAPTLHKKGISKGEKKKCGGRRKGGGANSWVKKQVPWERGMKHAVGFGRSRVEGVGGGSGRLS